MSIWRREAWENRCPLGAHEGGILLGLPKRTHLRTASFRIDEGKGSHPTRTGPLPAVTHSWGC